MKRIHLGLALHNHQPLGNFPWVFAAAFDRAYLPMLEALERHPAVRASLHYSGCLIEWLQASRPAFFDLLGVLLARGQVELLGGGYYEPILPSIPDHDKRGQIAKLSDFLQQRFGSRPSGMWLAERVWEQGLARIIAECGLSWTLVDDTAFKMAGLQEDELTGYFITEEQGYYLRLFPISKALRYSIPWHPVEKVMAYLERQAVEGEDRIVVLGDDGEKFGIWPKTWLHCWEKGWVEEFFSAIESNAGWLQTVRLGDYVSGHAPAGRVYLPCASYDEMMEWALPAQRSWELSGLRHKLEDEGRQDILGYLQGGYWRNFLVKYPEINCMHSKMLRVHAKVKRARALRGGDCGQDHLWRAQCNCPYWHGVFGGIYLSDIRAGTYSNLIEAEKRAEQALGEGGAAVCSRLDFDGDGREELLVEGGAFNLYFSPARGGALFEWDLRQPAYNLLSAVARRPEGYHQALLEQGTPCEDNRQEGLASIHDLIRVKDVDLAACLVYDRLPRHSLTDHFIANGLTPQDLEENNFVELGGFAGQPYDVALEMPGGAPAITLSRTAEVAAGDAPAQVRLSKTIAINAEQRELAVGYRLENLGGAPLELRFGSQWNINLLGGGGNPAAFYSLPGGEPEDKHLDSRGVMWGTQGLALHNTQLGIALELSLDRPLDIWRYPVETVSNSEGGVERIYQCSCLLILVPLSLAPGQALQFNYRWRVK